MLPATVMSMRSGSMALSAIRETRPARTHGGQLARQDVVTVLRPLLSEHVGRYRPATPSTPAKGNPFPWYGRVAEQGAARTPRLRRFDQSPRLRIAGPP